MAAYPEIRSTVTSETYEVTKNISLDGAPLFAGHHITGLEITYKGQEVTSVIYQAEYDPALPGGLLRVEQPPWLAEVIDRHRPKEQK